jgi:hypothetical protein
MSYSMAELKMIDALGGMDLTKSLSPIAVYGLLVQKCFFKDLSGDAVEQLRRASQAVLVEGKPFRLTPEFDALLLGM